MILFSISNGLIYCPLGTLTIDSPNINLNGVIIADKIVINGSSININYKDDIAGFIGTESEYYDFSDLEYLPESWLGDTDEDELFDIYEKVIDTDPLIPDTDGDGLPDGYEVLTLNTDPLEVDTDENGISDADEDFDNDNLNNLGEYLNKTGPFNPDTDEDGLLDGDEIKTYGTDPLNPDTDNDKLLDGEEGYDGTIYKKYGVYFDPLNPDTNGNGILDGDEVYTQSKNQSVETYDKAITEIKVDMDTNGSLERNLTIESMYGIDAMSSDVYAMIGEPFNFTSETSFESATITFKIDKSKLGDTKFDNLIILWYNEEKQIFEEMPTTRNWENSTVSATTTHFSQYMIVDSEKWYDNWEESFMELRKMWSSHTTYYKAMNTILVVDCSWKMDSADPISYSIEVGYNGVTEENHTEILSHIQGTQSNIDYYMKKYGRRKCNRAYICENIIGNMGSGDSAAVIMYSDHIESNTGLTGSTGPLYSAVQGVNSDGNSLWLNNAVQTALSYVSDSDTNMYRIIVLTNGDVSYGYELSSYDYTNVSLNIVSLGRGSIGSNLENIVYDTYGDVYYGYPSSALTNVTGNTIDIPPQFIGEDSDGDTIPDIVELYGLKPNGQPINTDPFKKDTDGDGLDDNIELNFVTEKLTSAVSMVEYYSAIGYSSDPTMPDADSDNVDDYLESLLGTNPNSKDTDGDGLSDGKEVQLWFDPLNPNPDGDSFNDYEEYINGTDPFSYDLTGFEWDSRFIKGIVLGDFIECNDIPTLLGQITGGFIPGYADIRDVIANARKGEWGYAVISGIGLVPLAGDAAKIASALEDFVLKHLDDAPTIASALLKVSEQVPDVLKYLPGSSLDNIANSLKNGKQFSKSEYTKLKEMFAAAGKNLDEIVDISFKYSDEIGKGISKIAGKYKNLECVECANEVMGYLKSIGQNGTRLNLTYGNRFIIHDLYSSTEAISKNGKHVAILYNNKVYDNIFPNGIDYNKWFNGFFAPGGEKTIEKINF